MALQRLLSVLFLGLALAACGGEPPAEPAGRDAAAPEPEAAAGGSDAGDAPTLDGAASMDDLPGLEDMAAAGDALDGMPPLDTGDGTGAGDGDASMDVPPIAEADAVAGEVADRQALMAEFQAAMMELSAAGNDPEKHAAAMERMQAASKAMGAARVRRDSARRSEDVDASLPEAWRQTRAVIRDGDEADVVVQLGDIDNLGYGWPSGFDPFSGKSTPVHGYPFAPEADDPEGTDRIMVVSGFQRGTAGGVDGYTRGTTRPDNAARPLVLEYDLQGTPVRAVVLQLFVDDFQSERMGSRYRVWINDRELPDLATAINALDQTGPIGKLLNLQLLPEYHEAVAGGRLEIRVDDPQTDAGDGFAFDFARLLVNPKGFRYTGTVRGIAVDTGAGQPLAGVLVSAGNVRQALTDAQGRFELTEVPAGLVVTTGSKPDYESDTEAADLEAGQVVDLVLELAPIRKEAEALAEQLQRERKVDLYGIYFDTAKATLKPESEDTLRQVLGVLESDPALRLVIAGHTDSEGGDAYNQSLSERRAASVVGWLVDQGIDPSRLASEGLGESRPVADNATEAGRALNRRVEVRLAD